MTKEIIIILLLIALFYLYQQNKRLKQQPLTYSSRGETLFSFQEEQLQEQKKDLQTHLDQALVIQAANKHKMEEQVQEINNLKSRLNVYEGVGASTSGEDEKLKAVLNERDELKRTNQNLELDNEKLTEDLNSILTE
jgi:predicted RND superfamily exporter protein